MPTIKSTYLGQLRTQATHLQSGNTLLTDAPTDNNGRGEAFSPTDLVAAALGSCMMTIVGIVAEREGISLEGVTWETTKKMASQPRRIEAIEIRITFPQGHQLSQVQQAKLRNAAQTCPVALSLHPDLRQELTIVFE
ncbi:OsmC family protein [Eisenibacter elegans]|jgi:uncharacterized OsmC-like protein|uniref:OsmC family protein n=1 Tax=Eisenibacter elegans TaxID=997 RepID=UPI0003FEF08F|nr:OsmC family protein [Eisenibacter elegans]